MRTGDFDVAVLGGGTAGCVVAARLSEHEGRSVCLVEAGPDYGPHEGGGWPEEMLATLELPESHDWPLEEGAFPSAKVIGGCSAHNACIIVRGSVRDYDEWGEGWDDAAMSPCLDRAADAIGARPLEPDEENPWAEVVRAGCEELGLGRLDGLDPAQGHAAPRFNVAQGARWNAAFAYLDPARGRPNLTVLADTLVDRIEFEGERAVAAVLRGPDGEAVIRAQRFVLTAGAMGSPAVLMRSGIGPEEHLAALSIPLREALPVGDGLEDHCGIAVRFTPAAALRDAVETHARRPGALPATTLLRLRSRHAPEDAWDTDSLPWAGWKLDEKGEAAEEPVVSLSSHLLKPRSSGTVRLRSADPAAFGEVDYGYLSDPGGHDLEVVLDGIEVLRELLGTRAVSAQLEGWAEASAHLEHERNLSEHVRSNISTYFHPTSTCAIGRVADRDARINGTENVYVADASAMPSVPRANTNLSALAVAERVASILA